MKKSGKKASTSSTSKSRTITDKTVKLLVENNIELQKKLILVATNVDELTKKVGKVMDLIEDASDNYIQSGMTMTETPSVKTSEKEGELIDKLESLISQNKTIARGLILLERYVKEKLPDEKHTRRRTSKVTKEKGDDLEPQPLPEFKF